MRRLPGLVALVAGAAGCGGSGAEPSRPAGAASTAATAHAPVRIVMGEYYFRPAGVTVRAGVPVTFVNEGGIQHTVADTTASGEIRSRLITPRPLDPGRSQTVTFRTPGSVEYTCTFHPTLMSGRVVVTR